MPTSSDPFIAAASLEGVPSSFRSARDGLDALLRDRGLRRTSPEDTGRSLLLGAAASATLEGDEITPDQLVAGQGGPTARGSLAVSGALLGQVGAWRHSPVQVMARLHALAAAGSVDDDRLGRPTDPVGADRLRELARLLSLPTQAPAMVVAALVHAEIATAAAFAGHDGVVARAAERLVLVVAGVDPASVTVPEAGHAAAPQAYRAALEGYRSGEPDGVHAWLLYAADAFTRGAAAAPLGRS